MSRIVLITGAAGGIGRHLVSKFAAEQDIVLAQDLSSEGLESLMSDCQPFGSRVVPVVADIMAANSLAAAVGEVIPTGRSIDILIANAGGVSSATLQQTTIETWHRDVDLNLNGVMHTVEAVRAGMIRQGKGAIVVIGSVNSILYLGHPAYSAAKAGLISYVKSLATEFGKFGIRSNIILPGTVQTPAWQARMDKDPTVFERLVKWYPLGRIVEPSDIAEAAFFLASELAKSISGVALPVDCGLLAGNRMMASELTLEEI
jgi:NAD(P)-dependent dehydrogenase (short-subunit alcohol dehydrogenase family)